MSKFSRDKGQRAERAAIKFLQPVIEKVYGCTVANPSGLDLPVLERNLMQTAKGGFDIVGLEWMALEIKHQETLQVNEWWLQAIKQCKAGQTAVLLYRSNHKPWKAVVEGLIPVSDHTAVRCRVTLDKDDFLLWFEQRLKAALA